MSTQVVFALDQLSAQTFVLFRARDERNQVIDLSGVTAILAVAINYTAGIAFTLPCTTNANGEIIVTTTEDDTDVPAGRYVYDVLLSDGRRIVSGLLTVNPAIGA